MSKKTQTTGGPTLASAWKREYEEGIAVTLPTGREVRMRPTISLGYLIRTGKIPDTLTQVAMDGIKVADDLSEPENIQKLADALGRYDEVLDIVCEETWLQPRVVAQPKGEDEVAVAWLPNQEKDFTWALINQPLSEWRTFHTRYGAGLESLPNGAAESQSAE